MNPTDEELVAFVDGELDAAARARMAAVAQRPDVAERIADFERSREALRAAGEAAPAFDGPVPAGMAAAAARLAAALEARASAAAATRGAGTGDADGATVQAPRQPNVQDNAGAGDRVVSIASRTRPRPRPWMRWTGVGAALAASVTLVVALLLTRGASAPEALLALDAGDIIASGHPLHAALERAPSATGVSVDGAVARPWLTFRAQGGAACRELEVAADSVATLAVVCRESAGWRVAAAERGIARPGNGDAGFVPAGAPDSARIADEVNRLIVGDPLSADEEARLLAARWE